MAAQAARGRGEVRGDVHLAGGGVVGADAAGLGEARADAKGLAEAVAVEGGVPPRGRVVVELLDDGRLFGGVDEVLNQVETRYVGHLLDEEWSLGRILACVLRIYIWRCRACIAIGDAVRSPIAIGDAVISVRAIIQELVSAWRLCECLRFEIILLCR